MDAFSPIPALLGGALIGLGALVIPSGGARRLAVAR